MITADHVSKLYGTRWALKDLSFQIAEHEVVGFLGLNGAGKTTVLKILSGLLWPSAGRVQIAGFDSIEQPRAVRAMTGFLPDKPPLYGEMTVRAMLCHAASLNGVPGRALHSRVDEVIELCQLKEVRHDLVDWLSHGYRKRVGIAQAIAHRPALVILDEPISGLDPQQIVGMRKLVRSLGEQHTVLVSSHILSEIAQTCDRILVLHEGQIVAQGTEEELLGGVVGGRIELTVHGDAQQARDLVARCAGVSDIVTTEQRDGLVQLGADFASPAVCETMVAALVEGGLGVRRVVEADGGGLEGVFLKLTRGSAVETAP